MVLALGEKDSREEGRRGRVEEAERQTDASAVAVELGRSDEIELVLGHQSATPDRGAILGGSRDRSTSSVVTAGGF